MKEDKKIQTKFKNVNPNPKPDMMTTKMEATIFQFGSRYTNFSHSSVSNIYLSICQEGIQRVT